MQFNVPRKGLSLGSRPRPLQWIAALIIYMAIPVLFLVHVVCFVEQQTAFRIFGIPRIPFGNYLLLDRGKLRKLNVVQRAGCVYCEYANALVAWVKANFNLLEAYACGIKHSTHREGQEHQNDFYSYEKFR